MEHFKKSKAVKLRSHLGKYLVASDENNENLRQSRNGTTKNSIWSVELVETKSHCNRLRNCYGRYLTATAAPFLLGMTGNKVIQADFDAGLSWKYEWEPIKEGSNVKLRSWCGKYLRGNGGTPPWRNSITHDDTSSATHNWILWGVEVVDLLLVNQNIIESFNQRSFGSYSSFDSYHEVDHSQSNSMLQVRV